MLHSHYYDALLAYRARGNADTYLSRAKAPKEKEMPLLTIFALDTLRRNDLATFDKLPRNPNPEHKQAITTWAVAKGAEALDAMKVRGLLDMTSAAPFQAAASGNWTAYDWYAKQGVHMEPGSAEKCFVLAAERGEDEGLRILQEHHHMGPIAITEAVSRAAENNHMGIVAENAPRALLDQSYVWEGKSRKALGLSLAEKRSLTGSQQELFAGYVEQVSVNPRIHPEKKQEILSGLVKSSIAFGNSAALEILTAVQDKGEPMLASVDQRAIRAGTRNWENPPRLP